MAGRRHAIPRRGRCACSESTCSRCSRSCHFCRGRITAAATSAPPWQLPSPSWRPGRRAGNIIFNPGPLARFENNNFRRPAGNAASEFIKLLSGPVAELETVLTAGPKPAGKREVPILRAVVNLETLKLSRERARSFKLGPQGPARSFDLEREYILAKRGLGPEERGASLATGARPARAGWPVALEGHRQPAVAKAGPEGACDRRVAPMVARLARGPPGWDPAGRRKNFRPNL